MPLVHLFFKPALDQFRQADAVAPQARLVLARHLALWEDPNRRAREIDRMRASNAEWDFMGRTYFVLALANLAIREPAQEQRYLSIIDTIIDETLRLESTRGMYFFLMNYARERPFLAQPARSTFIDGEIALMIAARQFVRVEPRFSPPLAQRADMLVRYLSQGPVMCGESYPDECWLFCNTLAIAAMHISDLVDGRDHSAFIQQWLQTAKTKLIDPKSGMLISSLMYNGRPMDGPEGTSIWMIAHCLQIVDPDFAAGQYRLARAQLGRQVFGFGYAHEWPPTWQGPSDIDSGPIIPILNASPGSSGLALLAAASFHDDAYLQELLTSLQFAAFPVHGSGELHYAASNQVGDAVLLYALVEGPLWDRVLGKSEKRP